MSNTAQPLPAPAPAPVMATPASPLKNPAISEVAKAPVAVTGTTEEPVAVNADGFLPGTILTPEQVAAHNNALRSKQAAALRKGKQ